MSAATITALPILPFEGAPTVVANPWGGHDYHFRGATQAPEIITVRTGLEEEARIVILFDGWAVLYRAELAINVPAPVYEAAALAVLAHAASIAHTAAYLENRGFQ